MEPPRHRGTRPRRDLTTALREALERVPWSLRQLALSLNLSHAALSDYKRGAQPTPATLGALGELLDERGKELCSAGRELKRYARRRGYAPDDDNAVANQLHTAHPLLQ
jgi:transcriptional regulator with XRE-family HTH domain